MGETHEPQKRVFFVFFLNQKQWLAVSGGNFHSSFFILHSSFKRGARRPALSLVTVASSASVTASVDVIVVVDVVVIILKHSARGGLQRR